MLLGDTRLVRMPGHHNENKSRCRRPNLPAPSDGTWALLRGHTRPLIPRHLTTGYTPRAPPQPPQNTGNTRQNMFSSPFFCICISPYSHSSGKWFLRCLALSSCSEIMSNVSKNEIQNCNFGFPSVSLRCGVWQAAAPVRNHLEALFRHNPRLS